MYKFRKIIMLALCLALVCAMSVTVFADTTHSDYKEYDGGANWAQSYATISQYRTCGYTEADSIYDSPSTFVSCRYAYIDANEATVYDYMSDNRFGMSYVGITLDSSTEMDWASYEFWAQVPTNTGTQDYEKAVFLDYAN